MARVAMVVGATGVVGAAVVRRYVDAGDKVYAVSRRADTRAIPGSVPLPLDLLDRDRCAEAVEGCGDVTHLVYAAVQEKPGALFEGWSDPAQMRLNGEMLVNVLEPLTKVANLEHVTLLQGTKAYGVHLGPIKVPARESEPRHPHENFYWLHEDYVREKQASADWSFTIVRPQQVVGGAIGSNLNQVPALGVYAAVLRERGEPLHFPGASSSVIFEIVDADLLAEAIDWFGREPAAANETFNITNGDVVSLRDAWPTVARAFGMGVGEERPMVLADEMSRCGAEWREIVAKYGLVAPVDLDEYVGESFTIADFHLGNTGAKAPSLVSTIKLRQAGFAECRDSEAVLAKWIRWFQQERLLPLPHDQSD